MKPLSPNLCVFQREDVIAAAYVDDLVVTGEDVKSTHPRICCLRNLDAKTSDSAGTSWDWKSPRRTNPFSQRIRIR